MSCTPFFRKMVFGMLTLCSLTFSKAQDLIVTTDNDSINARIYKEKKNTVYFYFVKNGETRSTVLSRSQMAHVQKNFFENAEVPRDFKPYQKFTGKRWRSGADAGYGYQLGRLPNGVDPEIRDYINKLRSGFHWGVNAHYFLTESLALGMDFNTFTSNQQNNALQVSFPDGGVENGVSNDVRITFIGPSLLTRVVSANNKNAFIAMLSLGYMSYTDVQKAGVRTTETSGNTFGFLSNIGYEFGINDHLSFGLSTSSTLGFVNKITSEEGGSSETRNLRDEGEDGINLGRINIMAGLKVHW